MESQQAITLVEKVLNFLSKLKCKMTCCKSSCMMDGVDAETQTNITEL